ncbi:hypothetical protein OG730_09945 [Streptomyces sp. NBC_01298]|uniref:hypothetical protein n=1 Tax=Streptomyces sp. NBC_01298 TaxID=2903817 RepID=UPI002E14BE72|nr:hypothetical protein OG730_09945 [Streptomyces sp. NBC_01298]
MSTPPSPDQIPQPPTQPAYMRPTAPRSITITFPTIHGKLAATLYITTLLLVGAIAWAQVDQALTARDEYVRFRHGQCAGSVYGVEDYDADDIAEYTEICGHAPRKSSK